MKIKAKIDRMVNAGNVKAIASVSLDGMFVVKNLKVMDGKKGQHVPQEVQHQRDYYPQQYPEPQYPDWVNDSDDGMLPMDMGVM